MNIIISVATSADHYIDDMTPNRLTLSTPSDWEDVYRLRASVDAILVGGETLRRDNPTLGLKGVAAQAVGAREPMRIIVSGSGEISPEAKIFHKGSAPIVIFSNSTRPELEDRATIVVAPMIDAAVIVTSLEKMGVESLLVEGGAKILDMFINSGLTSQIRLACNPTITVGDTAAPRFILPEWVAKREPKIDHFEEMVVERYTLRNDAVSDADREIMQRVVDYSLQSPPKDSCYRVGAAVVTLAGEEFYGYTLETSPTHHAEQAAIKKALDAGAELKGATIYASMEPCSQRSSEPESCSELVIRHGFSRAIFALYEPSHFVECHGAENMRRAGVEVIYLKDFATKVYEINSHVLNPK